MAVSSVNSPAQLSTSLLFLNCLLRDLGGGGEIGKGDHRLLLFTFNRAELYFCFALKVFHLFCILLRCSSGHAEDVTVYVMLFLDLVLFGTFHYFLQICPLNWKFLQAGKVCFPHFFRWESHIGREKEREGNREISSNFMT